jgi:hypothetical protein
VLSHHPSLSLRLSDHTHFKKITVAVHTHTNLWKSLMSISIRVVIDYWIKILMTKIFL